MLSKTEQRVIQHIINRLKEENLGSAGYHPEQLELMKMLNSWEDQLGRRKQIECVSRIYLDSWIIPALEHLLPGPDRDPELAEKLVD